MILRGNVFSKVLEMETGISILFSNNFDRSQDYKVIYLIHGMCGDSSNWIDYTMLPVYANDYITTAQCAQAGIYKKKEVAYTGDETDDEKIIAKG